MKTLTLSCKLKLLHARGVCLEVTTKRRSEYCAPPQRSRSCSRPRPRPISLARSLSPRSLFLFRSPPGARWSQWTGFQLFVLTFLLCKLLLMLDRRALSKRMPWFDCVWMGGALALCMPSSGGQSCSADASYGEAAMYAYTKPSKDCVAPLNSSFSSKRTSSSNFTL